MIFLKSIYLLLLLLSGCIFSHLIGQFEFPNDPNLDPNDLPAIWDHFEQNHSDHDNMADSYINEIMAAFKSRYGNRYTDIQYEAMAWYVLGNVNGEGVNTSAWNALSSTKQQELIDAFQSVNQEDCPGDECK